MRGQVWAVRLLNTPRMVPNAVLGKLQIATCHLPLATCHLQVRELMPGGVHLASLQRLVRLDLPEVFLKCHKVKL